MRKYNCPYCNERFYKEDLSKHIEKKHDELIPENYTAYHLTYDIVNNKQGHGNCTECGSPTKWNEKRQKYERLCGNPKCYAKVKQTYQKRMLKVYNKIHLLDDPVHQEKMLAARKISGKYKWSDGKEFTYTGQYEKKLMEFLDKTMEFKSNEVLAPGPILEYEFQGKKLHWITDFLLLPYNLIIEVKDGGDNPNKRNMPITRSKTLAKEKMITSMGKYSYLRLTNNDFLQLFQILAELKEKSLDDTNEDPIYRIHEETLLESFDKKYTRKYKDIDEFCRYITTPEEVSNWYFINKIRWTTDEEREKILKDSNLKDDCDSEDNPILWPNYILENHKGICFDHAFFMAYCCNKFKNAKPYFMSIYSFIHPNFTDNAFCYGHSVCGIDIKGEGTFIFDYNPKNGNSLLGPFKNIKEAEKEYKDVYDNKIRLALMYEGNLLSSNNSKSEIITTDISNNSKLFKNFMKYYNGATLQSKVIPEFYSIIEKAQKKNAKFTLINDTKDIVKILHFAFGQIKNNISNVIDSVHDKVFGEETSLDESLLNMTFYHASFKLYNNIIPANAPSMGTKLYEPHWSVYMWSNRDNAIAYLLWNALYLHLMFNIPKAERKELRKEFECDAFEKVLYVTQRMYDLLVNLQVKGYIYTIKPNILDIPDMRLGHSSAQEEYTLNHDAKISHREDIVVNQNILDKYVVILSNEDMAKKVDKIYNTFRTSSSIFWNKDERMNIQRKYDALKKEGKIDYNKPLAPQLREETEVLDESLLNMTFYHASKQLYKNVIPAQAPSMGTKLYEPHWSVYMWNNRDNAIVYLMWITIYQLFCDNPSELEKVAKNIKIDVWNKVLLTKSNKLYDLLLGKNGYIYTIKPNILDIPDMRLGHSYAQEEYTLNHDAKISHREDITITQDILDKYVVLVSEEEFDKRKKELKTKRRTFSFIFNDKDTKKYLNQKYDNLLKLGKIDYNKPLAPQLREETSLDESVYIEEASEWESILSLAKNEFNKMDKMDSMFNIDYDERLVDHPNKNIECYTICTIKPKDSLINKEYQDKFRRNINAYWMENIMYPGSSKNRSGWNFVSFYNDEEKPTDGWNLAVYKK